VIHLLAFCFVTMMRTKTNLQAWHFLEQNDNSYTRTDIGNYYFIMFICVLMMASHSDNDELKARLYCLSVCLSVYLSVHLLCTKRCISLINAKVFNFLNLLQFF
jgi:hypothetical protein